MTYHQLVAHQAGPEVEMYDGLWDLRPGRGAVAARAT